MTAYDPDFSFVPFYSVPLLILSIIAILAVALRLWARRIKKLRLELSDYLIVLGLVRRFSAKEWFAF